MLLILASVMVFIVLHLLFFLFKKHPTPPLSYLDRKFCT